MATLFPFPPPIQKLAVIAVCLPDKDRSDDLQGGISRTAAAAAAAAVGTAAGCL